MQIGTLLGLGWSLVSLLTIPINRRLPSQLHAKRRIRPLRPTITTQSQPSELKNATEQARQDPFLLSETKFQDISLTPQTQRAVHEVLRLEIMTEIQQKVFHAARQGQSILGTSKTGSGKTLSYLLPVIERLSDMDLTLYRPNSNIGCLIVAPTRELVIQIGKEAQALLTYHDNRNVLTLYGGTGVGGDVARLTRQLPTILVATPGRLVDHMEQTRIRGRKFVDIISETRIVVLDEVDLLLEGFVPESKRLLSALQRPSLRQTLLFSATIPRHLKTSLEDLLPPDYLSIECRERSPRVEERFYILPNVEAYVSTLISIIEKATTLDKNYKIIVFFPAARLVRFFSDVFQIALGIPVLEIHSRMSQATRRDVSKTFSESTRCILFSSDVSARGVDYPDVSLVVQYGAPYNKNLYVHRLGRTARAGREGVGLLVFLPFESHRLNDYAFSREDTYTEVDDSAQRSKVDLIRRLIRGGHPVLKPSAKAAYLAFLAYYEAYMKDIKRNIIVDSGRIFAETVGLTELPPLPVQLARKLDKPI